MQIYVRIAQVIEVFWWNWYIKWKKILF